MITILFWFELASKLAFELACFDLASNGISLGQKWNLAPYGIPFGTKSIGKMKLQSKLGLNKPDSGSISLSGYGRMRDVPHFILQLLAYDLKS